MAFGEEEPSERREEGQDWVQAVFDLADEYIDAGGPLWTDCRPDEEANQDGVTDVLLLRMCPQWMYTLDWSAIVFSPIQIGLFDIWDEMIDGYGATSFDVDRDSVSISGEHGGVFYRLVIYYEPVDLIDFVFGQWGDGRERGWSQFEKSVPLDVEKVKRK